MMTEDELREHVRCARSFGRARGHTLRIGADEGESIAVCALAEALVRWDPERYPFRGYALQIAGNRICDEHRRIYGQEQRVRRAFVSDARLENVGLPEHVSARVEALWLARRLPSEDFGLVSTVLTGESPTVYARTVHKSNATRRRTRLMSLIREQAMVSP